MKPSCHRLEAVIQRAQQNALKEVAARRKNGEKDAVIEKLHRSTGDLGTARGISKTRDAACVQGAFELNLHEKHWSESDAGEVRRIQHRFDNDAVKEMLRVGKELSRPRRYRPGTRTAPDKFAFVAQKRAEYKAGGGDWRCLEGGLERGWRGACLAATLAYLHQNGLVRNKMVAAT